MNWVFPLSVFGTKHVRIGGMNKEKIWHGNTDKSQSFAVSLGHAWRGLYIAIKWESNFKRQLGILIIVLIGSILLNIGSARIALITIVGALVLALELSNSALEAVADVVQPEYHKDIQRAKDMMAGAVLIVSILAVLVGLILLGPPLLSRLY